MKRQFLAPVRTKVPVTEGRNGVTGVPLARALAQKHGLGQPTGLSRYGQTLEKLQERYLKGSKHRRVDQDEEEEEEDEDSEDDEDFVADSDDDDDDSDSDETSDEEGEEDEEEEGEGEGAEDWDEEDDGEGDGDSEEDDETRGEQVEEADSETIRREEKRAAIMRKKEAKFNIKGFKEKLGKRDAHALMEQDEKGKWREVEDDESEGSVAEEETFAEDGGSDLNHVFAGAWRRCVAQFGVVGLKDILTNKTNDVLSKEQRRRTAKAVERFRQLDAAIAALRESLVKRLSEETDESSKRLSKLILDSLSYTTVKVVSIGSMIAAGLSDEVRRCLATNSTVLPKSGYFVHFERVDDDGAKHSLNMVLTRLATGAMMAVNYLVRVLGIMKYHAARLAKDTALKAGGAAKVDSNAFLREHCLIDAKAVVNFYCAKFLGQLVFVKGIVYPDLPLPLLFQTAYEECVTQMRK